MTIQNEKITAKETYVVDENISRAIKISDQFYRDFFKRFLDIVIVLILLPVVVPVLVTLLVLVYVTCGSPLYAQYRLGKDGKIFKMWKFRTMVHSADEVLDRYLAGNPNAKTEWDQYQKLENDPRITSIGGILRKSSMDELPQLWNVLTGDMSLVGPRPMMVNQESLYPGSAYYRLRPGITGLWQVSDRNQTSFASRANFDTKYEQSLSLATDMKTLATTVKVVVQCTGR